MPHPFFDAISTDKELSPHCRLDIVDLPNAHIPKDKIKAIVLGADPTNKGISGEGLIQLKKVFGIDSEYEKYFWGPQLRNLKALNLSKDNVYVQNVCRNYFKAETSISVILIEYKICITFTVNFIN